MRAKLFVEIVSTSEDGKRVLVKNEVYSEPVWIDSEKLNKQNQVVEFILSQETRKQHRVSHPETNTFVDSELSTPLEKVQNIKTNSDSILDDLLGTDNSKESGQPTRNSSDKTVLSQAQGKPSPWESLIKNGSIHSPENTVKKIDEAKEPFENKSFDSDESNQSQDNLFFSPAEPVVAFHQDADSLKEIQTESDSNYGTIHNQPAARQDQGINQQSIYNKVMEYRVRSKMTQEKIASLGRNPIDLEPYMEIADGVLCLIVNWTEPVSSQQGSIAIKVPQSSTGQFVVPAWKFALFMRQIKSQITKIEAPLMIQSAGFDFFYE